MLMVHCLTHNSVLCFVVRASLYNLVNKLTLLHYSFLYVYFTLLYMFRETMCSSSGEVTVSMPHLAFVTLCTWPSGMQVGMNMVKVKPHPDLTLTEWQMLDVALIQLLLLMMNTQFPETYIE